MDENDGTEGDREVAEVDPREARREVGGRWKCGDCTHAWAAGLFDGEGCITLYAQRKPTGRVTWRATLRMTLRKREPLKRLQEMYGGLLTTTTRSWGSTYHVWIRQNAPQISEVLGRWLPWLIEKKPQAMVALEFCRFISERRQGEVYSKRDQARCARWERKLKALKRN